MDIQATQEILFPVIAVTLEEVVIAAIAVCLVTLDLAD